MDSERLGSCTTLYLLPKAGVQRTTDIYLIDLTPVKWKNDNLFPFRLRDKMLLMIWGYNVCKNLTPASEGQNTKCMIWYHFSQKMFTLDFKHSEKRRRGKEVPNLWISCTKCVRSKVNLILSLFCLFASYVHESLDMVVTLGSWDVPIQRSCSHLWFLIMGWIIPGLRLLEI